MSTNRRKRILACLKKSGPLTVAETTRRINAEHGREYTETIIESDWRVMSTPGPQQTIRIGDKDGELVGFLTDYGQKQDVTFDGGIGASGKPVVRQEQQLGI